MQDRLESLKRQCEARRAARAQPQGSDDNGSSPAASPPKPSTASPLSPLKASGEASSAFVAARCRPAADPGRPSAGIAASAGNGEKVALRLANCEGQPAGPLRCNAYFGPEATTEDLFAHAVPVVERCLDGHHGAIVCYGASGAGKTFTMSGQEGPLGGPAAAQQGLAQLAARRLFDLVQERSARGSVFVVEVSFVEIYVGDGDREQLFDLLDDSDRKKLEVKQDPLSLRSFVCDGLRRVPVASAAELCQAIGAGRRRCALLESARGIRARLAHCLLTLTLECLSIQPGSSETLAQRGKLVLADLAGSDGASEPRGDDEGLLRRRAALERAFAAVGAAASGAGGAQAPGPRDSALALLTRDCLGGGALSLLVTCLSPELEAASETVKTLTWAQQLVTTRSMAGVSNINKEQSKLSEMKEKHADALRALQESVHSSKKDREDELSVTQARKIDELRQDLTRSLGEELEQMRLQAQQDFEELRVSLGQMEDGALRKQTEEAEAAMSGVRAELQESVRAQKAVEAEVSELRVRLAAAEERARLLQERQEDLRKERADLDEERRGLRQQCEEQWQRASAAEGELHQLKAECEVQRLERGRLGGLRDEAAEALRRESAAWRGREAELRSAAEELRGKLEEAKREAEVEALKAESRRLEGEAALRLQVERLEAEAASRQEQLRQAEQLRERLEAERAAALQREEEARRQSQQERQQLERLDQELRQSMAREQELSQMLSEVQDSIISAGAAPDDDDPSTGELEG